MECVLPGVLVEQLKPGSPTPVIFKHVFRMNADPVAAAAGLIIAAKAEAINLGFTISDGRKMDRDALESVALVMGRLAAGIAAAGGQLILLLDEAQVRH